MTIRAALVEALRETRGDRAAAAAGLMIGRSTLYRKIRDLEIRREEYAPAPVIEIPLRHAA